MIVSFRRRRHLSKLAPHLPSPKRSFGLAQAGKRGEGVGRRALVAGFAAALAARSAFAQARPVRLAVAWTGVPVAQLTEAGWPEYAALVEELRRLGLVEGTTLAIDRFSTAGAAEGGFDDVARAVVAARPDVILAVGSRLTLALKAATATIPIVFSAALPLELGIVGSLARPEGNVTGMALDAGPELTGKRMQLLRDAMPAMAILAYLGTPQTWEAAAGAQVQAAAKQLNLTAVPVLVDPVSEATISGRLAALSARRNVGLMINTAPDFEPLAAWISEIALRYGWPAITQSRAFPAAGLLMAYGPAPLAQFRKAAGYIDRIAKGARPGDLPVQQPTDFDFVVNQSTAKALGLTLPEHLMVFATEIIE